MLRWMHIWNIAQKRWQTREDTTYQLKRRRLLPDVRDPPEREDAVHDGHLIICMGWHGGLLHGGRDGMRG